MCIKRHSPVIEAAIDRSIAALKLSLHSLSLCRSLYFCGKLSKELVRLRSPPPTDRAERMEASVQVTPYTEHQAGSSEFIDTA